jgi:protein-export membrane protein SecD
MTEKEKNFFIFACLLFLAFLALNVIHPFLKIPFLPQKPFKLGLDLQGGIHLIYEADLSQVEEKDKTAALNSLRDVIEKRVNYFGVKEPIVQIQGTRLIVELAGVIDPATAIREIGKTPFLEFREEKENFQEIVEKNKKGESFEEPFKPTPLTGRYLKRAELVFDPTTNEPTVSLQFTEEGAKIFEELTEKNVGKILAIYLDGQPISLPVVKEKIPSGRAQITGRFSVEEAKELVQNLNAGALPVPIKLISQEVVGPTLGRVSLEKSLKAGIFGFLGIVVFMILVYRLPGLLASLALSFYIVFVLAIFKIASVTLTLAGIAGFILSIGMAVDANILIFSRMREELAEGKNYSLAMEEGGKRAWPSIRDSNCNTILVSFILFTFGTSFVKGFALTLMIGVIMSMFSAIFITSTLLRLFKKEKEEKVAWFWR